MASLLDRAYIPSLGLSDLKDTSTYLRPCIVSRTLTHRYDFLGHSFACIVLYHVAYPSTPRNSSLPKGLFGNKIKIETRGAIASLRLDRRTSGQV